MADVLEIELPLPPQEASPNNHASRLARIRAIAAYRQLVALIASRRATAPGWCSGHPVRMSLTFQLRGSADGHYRPSDPDNALAACKGLIDGLVDAGLIVDDSWRWLEIGSIRCDRDAGPGVLVQLEVIE
jgi:hypothetical protein